MRKNLILFPSVQPNSFKGQNITEGHYCKQICDRAKPLLESWGWDVTIPWEYDSNGDLKELIAQRKEGQRLQAIRPHFVVSVHVDYTGTPKKNGVLMIYRNSRPNDKVWADALGRIMGELTGLGYEKTVDESYTNVKRLAIMSVPGPNVLVEIGEMGTISEAAWLVAHKGKVAAALAGAIEQSVHKIYGTPLDAEEDMPVDKVSPATVKPELEKLVKAGLINKPEAHNIDDAASVGLLWTVLGRLAEKAGIVPKT